MFLTIICTSTVLQYSINGVSCKGKDDEYHEEVK